MQSVCVMNWLLYSTTSKTGLCHTERERKFYLSNILSDTDCGAKSLKFIIYRTLKLPI